MLCARIHSGSWAYKVSTKQMRMSLFMDAIFGAREWRKAEKMKNN
jgi:hypothetical protein